MIIELVYFKNHFDVHRYDKRLNYVETHINPHQNISIYLKAIMICFNCLRPQKEDFESYLLRKGPNKLAVYQIF